MAEDGETEHITLVGVHIEPNNCPIEEELTLTMDFDTKVDVVGARWEVRFIADTAAKRKIVCLGQTKEQDYHTGQHQMSFTVDKIDVSHLKRHVVANVGLLTASLYDYNNVEYVQVNMVTQVTATPFAPSCCHDLPFRPALYPLTPFYSPLARPVMLCTR